MIKKFLTFSFLSLFGTYSLGLVGVLDDPKGNAQLDLAKLDLANIDMRKAIPTEGAASQQTQTSKQSNQKPDGHYTLKAMR